MGNTPKRHTLTAALPYTNGPIHIGHLAGVYVPADIYARYLRNKGEDVAFICGSDEHGVAISMKARKEGITPQEVIDRYHSMIDQSFKEFGISFDHYSRTSSQTHHQTASAFFTALDKNNEFIEEVTEQLYDPEAQQFLADRFVTGTCPKCQFEEAYGDQCEQCGSSLNATDLINPVSTLSGATPTLKKTKHWFLPLDRYQDFLKEWILEGHSKDWKPNVYGQVKSWLDDGLKPRAVTRDLDWGIPVPAAGGEGKVLYVWFDAPIGYISSTKEWAAAKEIDWEPYWKDKNTELIHFIGKDNIVFHCIIFPAMLKAEGSYILPKNVPANEFLNLEGNKLSTSKNWAVWLHEYLVDFPDQQDALRYALTANAPENKDNDFTWKDFQARNNNELVAIYGNFINRVIVLTQKYYNGIVPAPNAFSDADTAILEALKNAPKTIGDSLDRFRFREASQLMMNLARAGNKYLADEEPWKLIKTDPERVQTIMYVAVQVAAGLSIVSEPFLPFSAKKLKEMLSLPSDNSWEIVQSELLPARSKLGRSELLFSKIEDDSIQKQLDKLEATKQKNIQEAETKVAPVKETVSFDDFTKLDVRVGTILSAEKVTKTKKLLVLSVDVGTEVRTIVSGIAQDYTPEEVVGQKVSVLVNLAPRKIRGIESQGMILMSENASGKLIFVSTTDPNAQSGLPIS